MAADYILRHTRRDCDTSDRFGDARSPGVFGEQKEGTTFMITGAIVMLVGIIVGWALARSADTP